jgi:hypothetical protein
VGLAAEKMEVLISPPNIQVAEFKIKGTTPYVHQKFSEAAKEAIQKTQEAGSTAKKGKKREPKDFMAAYRNAIHRATQGWAGIPCAAFRNALIDCCRLVGFVMTRAKLSVFIMADGFESDGTPLVKITKGEPRYHCQPMPNANGNVDLRPMPMWEPGWEAVVKIRFDADQFTHADIANLLLRVGQQVGIGTGRHNSPKGFGCGWGEFEILD